MPSEVALSKSEQNLIRHAPERAVGGFTRRDSTMLFYSLIHAVLKPDHVVLDFGAGRGAQIETPFPYKRDLVTLKGKVQRVVGVDVDPAVLENPIVDEAHVFVPGQPLPFEDGAFDVIFSDWVADHVDDPASFVAEVDRLLKPGGWFFARTPNRFGAIAIGATLIPNALHTAVLSRLQPDRKDKDVFPTRYRMNTVAAVRRLFPRDRWRNHSTTIDTELMYLTRFSFLYGLSEFVAPLLPSRLKPLLFIMAQKHAAPAPGPHAQ